MSRSDHDRSRRDCARRVTAGKGADGRVLGGRLGEGVEVERSVAEAQDGRAEIARSR